MTFRAIDIALGAPWAMEPLALQGLLNIAARDHDATPEALEAYRAKALANGERAEIRGGVAIIRAIGPMFKRANLLTEISGATSYDVMRRDLQAAVDESKVHAILLDVDSPGGEASGANELARAIYAARRVKPITAYVGGTGASAAYWIAAAAGEVVVDPLALLGSIGVQVAMREQSPAKGSTNYRFVSSQSPMKNAGPGTVAGAAATQRLVDRLADVFVESVALYRGVTPATVLSDFGQGGVFVGAAAVKAGLADRVGSFESVIAELGRR